MVENQSNDKWNRLKKIILRDVSIYGAMLVAVLLFNLITGHGCPINWLLHIRCPFCGMTRAHLAALRLDFGTAFSHHPLFFLGIPYILLVTNEDLFRGKWKKVYIIAVALLTALFLIRYIVSLF